MKLKVILQTGDDGYFVATVPSLPGCVSQAKTKTGVLKNIREAIALYLEPDPKKVRPSKSHQVLTLAV
ncbi:MAG: type II toxin-antitoxin system HicB family antitoxin [Deltaproteobacteria bacterium]|nr:type II toxin-antitoxin system HicB family antitoxin [Deltaproteobacteria bacterium]